MIAVFQKRHRARNDRGCERSTRRNAVPAAALGRESRAGRNHVAVFSEVRVFRKLVAVLFKRADRYNVFVRRRITKRGSSVVARRRNTDNVAVNGKLGRPRKRVGKRIRAERHVHDVRVAFYRIVKPEHKVRGASERAVLVALGFYNKQCDFRRDTHGTFAVHTRRNNAGNRCAVSLLVLNYRPIVSPVFFRVVLHDFVRRRVIGIFGNSARKFDMVGVDTRVDNGNRHARTLVSVPRRADIDVIYVRLIFVKRIAHRVFGLRRFSPFARNAFFIDNVAYPRVEVGRKFVDVFAVIAAPHNVINRYAVRQP